MISSKQPFTDLSIGPMLWASFFRMQAIAIVGRLKLKLLYVVVVDVDESVIVFSLINVDPLVKKSSVPDDLV